MSGVASYLGKLLLESLLKFSHRLDLLSQLFTFAINLSLDNSAFILQQVLVFDLGLEQLDLHLLGLDFAFVVFHLLARIVDFNFNRVEFLNHRLNLRGQTLARCHGCVVVIFGILGDYHLLLNLAFDLRLELLLETLHLLLIDLHLILIVLLLNVVGSDRLRDFAPDRRVFFHLSSSQLFVFLKLILNHSHAFLEASTKVNSFLALAIKHLLMHQVQLRVLGQQQLRHGLKRFTFAQIGFHLLLYVVELG